MRILLIITALMAAPSVGAVDVYDYYGYRQNSLYLSVVAATEEFNGVQCNREGTEFEWYFTAGYNNDDMFKITVHCGASSVNKDFDSLSLQFYFLVSESGLLHLTCFDHTYVNPKFGWRDPMAKCTQ